MDSRTDRPRRPRPITLSAYGLRRFTRTEAGVQNVARAARELINLQQRLPPGPTPLPRKFWLTALLLPRYWSNLLGKCLAREQMPSPRANARPVMETTAYFRDHPSSTMPDGKPTVLVIDDDPDLRASVGRLLRSVGLQAQLFASISDFLKQDPPDGLICLVLDVRFPVVLISPWRTAGERGADRYPRSRIGDESVRRRSSGPGQPNHRMSLTSKEIGLTDFPREDRPPLLIPFLAFRVMVGCGMAMLLLAWVGTYLGVKGRLEQNRLLLWCVFLSFPCPISRS
jgi:hypothetical protein